MTKHIDARSPWRSVGSAGKYPDWLRELAGASGVYAIRVPGFIAQHVVVYVGESHTGHLAKTIARHFQAWNRQGELPSWLKGSTADPGRTYARGDCEVCVRACEASQAVALQDEWIAELHPRDNILGAPPEKDEEVPF